MTTQEEIKKDKEKGVWIVYDLEANRKIQKLLAKEKFAFRFDPSLKITEEKALSKQKQEDIKECGKAINEAIIRTAKLKKQEFKDAVEKIVPFAELSPERWEELKQEFLKVLGEEK